MTGANLGGPTDPSSRAAPCPVTGLPPFVITRGGDYFFAPGVKAMRELAYGSKFDVLPAKLPYGGYSMGDATTPTLLSEERLKGYAGQIFTGARDVVRVGMPSPVPADPAAAPVAFVARLAHVKQALGMRTDASSQMITSVPHHQEAVRTISTGQDMIVSTQPDSVTGAKRALMIKILEAGWAALSTPQESGYVRLARVTKRSIEATLRRTRSVRPSTAQTPDRLRPTRHQRPVRHTRPGLVDRDGRRPAFLSRAFDPGRARVACRHQGLQTRGRRPGDVEVWSILMFLDIIGNYLQQEELKALGVQAGREFLTHIDTLIVKARKQPSAPHTNLLAAFVSLEPMFTDPTKPNALPVEAYYGLVRMLLLEVASSAIVIAPTLGAVVHTALTAGIDLPSLHPAAHEGDAVAGEVRRRHRRLLYETWRLNPDRQAADAAQQPG